MGTSELLETIFSDVYNFAVKQDLWFGIFHEDSPIHNDVYEACLFTTLCMFLHESKRIEGKSLGEFVFQYSPMGYHQEYSSYQDSKDDRLTSEEATLRQKRHRLFSSRAGRDNNPQWSAMRKDSEHEWSFYFTLQYADKNLSENALKNADTFKRIGNLYKDMNTALVSEKDDGYTARLGVAYKKFLSKLNKIQYANYLELLQELLRHIESDKAYYGINLYRFEKSLCAFSTTHYVKRLLECQNEAEEINVLNEATMLKDIWFPKLKEAFASLRTYEATQLIGKVFEMGLCAKTFSEFLGMVVVSACLVIDELAEKGCLGDKWESLFIDMTNQMAERVFYAPSEIDFTAPDGSQEKFKKLLAFPTQAVIFQEKKLRET